MADTEHMLSTKDNPYNPWTDFDNWRIWDEREGKYNSLSLLARVTRTSDEVPDEMMDQDIEAAIEEIVDYNVSGVHIKVPKPKDSQS
jgi:hypothetical protein